MAKKNKAGKVLLASLVILLAGGVAATITAGALTGWTFGVNDPFSEVKIESAEVDYDGTAKKLDISLPEGASYELKILNEEGEVVSEAKEIGLYEFVYKVTIEGETREFKAKLTIINPSTLDSQFIENGVTIKKANYFTEGENSVAEITYSVEPAGVDQTIEVSNIEWAPDDQSDTDNDINYHSQSVTTYVQPSIDVSNNKIKIVNPNNLAFDHEINITVASVLDENVNATIKVGYKRKWKVENSLKTELDITYGDFFTGINKIVLNTKNLTNTIFPNQSFQWNFTLTDVYFINNASVGPSNIRANKLTAQQYVASTFAAALSNISTNNVGTTSPWNGPNFTMKITNHDYIGYHTMIIDDDWNKTSTNKNDFADFLLEYCLNFQKNTSSPFSTELMQKLVSANYGYNLYEFYTVFTNYQNPNAQQEAFLKVPKEYIELDFGEAGSVPYYEIFDKDPEDLLYVYINAGPDENIVLEDSSVLF